jgi:hypothetical protein
MFTNSTSWYLCKLDEIRMTETVCSKVCMSMFNSLEFRWLPIEVIKLKYYMLFSWKFGQIFALFAYYSRTICFFLPIINKFVNLPQRKFCSGKNLTFFFSFAGDLKFKKVLRNGFRWFKLPFHCQPARSSRNYYRPDKVFLHTISLQRTTYLSYFASLVLLEQSCWSWFLFSIIAHN